MICQSCEKKKASTHIKTILNGELKEFNLCSDCAAKLGYGSFFSSIVPDLDKLFGSFMDTLNEGENARRCSFCGSSFEDIAKSGKVGCAHCYDTFYDELLPSIQRIHGRTVHAGKLASSAGAEMKIKSDLMQLKKDLEQAIKTQEFEKAAELRDKIREIEKNLREENNDPDERKDGSV